MKLVVFITFICCFSCTKERKPTAQKENIGYKMYLKTGDIVFRESNQTKHLIFKEIHNTILNDCGVVEIDDENVWVWFVDQRVKRLPIHIWLRSGTDVYFAATRYAEHNSLIPSKFKLAMIRFKGRPEDYKYKWESKAVYNAEFVRKLYSKILNTEITTLENKYLYRNGTSKVEFKNLVTPYQLYTSPYFVEVFNSFPKQNDSVENNNEPIISNQ